MKTIRFVIAVLAACYLATAVAQATQGDAFELGKKFFKEGNYEKARQYFEQAESEGESAPALDNNLGSTYYKLGLYEKARERFLKLKALPEWHDLAVYNLGLIEQKTGQYENARRYFFEALSAPSSEEIRYLAADSYDKLENYFQSSQKMYRLVSAAAGYDDNVFRADVTEAVESSNKEDFYLDVYGSLGAIWSGTARQGNRWNLGLYSRSYADLSEYDFAQLAGELSHHRTLAGVIWQLALKPEVLFLDGKYFATYGISHLQLTETVGQWRYRLKTEFAQVSTASEYDYLDGLRAKARLDAKGRADNNRWYAYYQWEYNDRDDQQLGGEFTSHCPERHTLSVDNSREVSPVFEIDLRYQFRDTRYRDANRELVAGNVQVVRREEDRSQSSVRFNYLAGKNATYFLKYRYLDNESNIASKNYESNEISIGVDAYF